MSVDHSGHRGRLKRAYREDGLLSFSPHEVIELMLYPVLPRRDINELAHEISDQCGGVCGVFSKSKEELLSLGLSETVASVLSAYGECVKSYRESSTASGKHITNRGEKAQITEGLSDKDCVSAVLLSPAREIISVIDLPEKERISFLVSRVLSYDASSVMLVCPAEKQIGTQEFIILAAALESIGCRLES